MPPLSTRRSAKNLFRKFTSSSGTVSKGESSKSGGGDRNSGSSGESSKSVGGGRNSDGSGGSGEKEIDEVTLEAPDGWECCAEGCGTRIFYAHPLYPTHHLPVPYMYPLMNNGPLCEHQPCLKCKPIKANEGEDVRGEKEKNVEDGVWPVRDGEEGRYWVCCIGACQNHIPLSTRPPISHPKGRPDAPWHDIPMADKSRTVAYPTGKYSSDSLWRNYNCEHQMCANCEVFDAKGREIVDHDRWGGGGQVKERSQGLFRSWGKKMGKGRSN